MGVSTRTLCAAFALLAGTATAQICPDPANDTFWKNDTLPDVPSGLTTVAVIPGVCDGEAIGSRFVFPPNTAPQLLKSVTIPFGEQFGTPGFQALVNVEIYERRPGDAPYPNPGTKIFDLNADASSDLQIASHGLNTLDMTPYGVIVQGEFSVVSRTNFNVAFPGCPPTGAPANYFTDNSGCQPGRNYLDIAGQGWSDPATAAVLGFPLCPVFFSGNWAIRACTEDSGTPASATVRNESGTNPLWYDSLTQPKLGTTWISSVDIASAGAAASFIASVSSGPIGGVFLPQGELLIDLTGPLIAPINVAFGAHAIPIPSDINLIGFSVYTQGATFSPGTIQLTNAIDLILGL